MKLDNIIAERPTKTVYRDGDKCVKVFNKEFSKANVLNEALNQARIEETGLNIPKVIEVTTIDGKWAIVSDYIEGKTLAQLMEEDSANADKYLERFVDLQIEVQKKTCLHLNKLKDKMNEKIGESKLDATTRYELRTRLEGMPKHNKVCHGDFNPSNVLIDANDNAYILDWAHATQGNASGDVATTYLYFLLNHNEEAAKKYLDLFCKKSDTAKQYVQKWIPIAAAALSAKSNEADAKFLMQFCDVVDYE